MKQERQKANAVQKALDILLAFVPENQEMGPTELSKKLQFHKATTSRIMLDLAGKGFLQQSLHTKKFSLGRSALEIGKAINLSLSSNLVPLAKPHIDDLRATIRDTIVLEVFTGTATFVAYIAEGPQYICLAGRLGDRLPVHGAAGAKSVLAFLAPELVSRILGDNLPPLTPNTITNPRLLRNELEQIRRQGFSCSNGEVDIGINAIAAPVFNHSNEPVAAVVVAGPSNRIPIGADSPLVPPLKETAARITDELQCRNSDPR
ncbi:IclR family transcriptional regulator [Candidatus Poribacteria bacterium]|nr:IclR family transcriptional regulator [Candidatus Poribacteria bacterium]